MTAYVLVAGYWLGGWAWDDVAPELRAAGHEVYPVTLTGLGDRVDLAGPDVGLETHVNDIVSTVVGNDLHDVVLVGHSGGGMPVSMAADRIPERIAKVVYIESGPLLEGMSQADTVSPTAKEERLAALAAGDWQVPLPDWAELGGPGGIFIAGLGDKERATFAERAVPQPTLTTTDPVHFENSEVVNKIPHVLITSSFPLAQVEAMRAANDPYFAGFAGKEWEILEVPTGHWPMFSEPVKLAEALLTAAE